jgi:hypothetical protein
MLGAGAVDAYWTDAFHNKLRTSVEGFNLVTTDDLVAKTLELL